jgi:transposase
MTVTMRDPSDLMTLRGLARAEADARQRDRYRAVLLAAEGAGGGGELEGDQIAGRVGRSPRFVDQWVARYRAGGLDGLRPRKARGRAPKLDAANRQAFKARVLAGPTAADGGACALRGADARRILAAEFGVELTLGGVYALMHRLNLACLRPRPRHRKNDPAAMATWLDRAPLLSTR